jgi:hypothetical protein
MGRLQLMGQRRALDALRGCAIRRARRVVSGEYLSCIDDPDMSKRLREVADEPPRGRVVLLRDQSDVSQAPSSLYLTRG